LKRKIVSGIMPILLLISMLLASFETREASASPAVRIYVDMPPQGYIPGIPVDQILKVTIYIESPPEWENTADGIVGWAFFVHVDPEVLEPITVKSATNGYFLYDFAYDQWYWTAILFGMDKEAGIFIDISEFIMGYETLGVGAGGDGKLCELWFKSKSQTAYTPIDIYHWMPDGLRQPYYWTPDGLPHPCDIVEDGYYNALPATIDIDPDTLNLKSQGQWITAYIQLPEGYNPEDIDATTILLNGTLSPVLDPKYDFVTNSSEYLVDHNEDGILERMVKFNRTEVTSWIYNDLGIEYDNVTLTITGEADGAPFEGTDTVKVLLPGDADDDGDVDANDLYIFSRCYEMSIENPGYHPLADFNEDEYINSEDLYILSDNYGKNAVLC